MENKKNILDILGLLSIFAVIFNKFQLLNRSTKTTVISDNALKAIQDPAKASQLRAAVDNYHDTGKWNEEKLEAIQ